jgi:dihydroxyacetone kinase-like protein
MTPANFSVFLEQSKAAVSKRGGVEEGAKTMLDAVAFAERSVSTTDANVIGGVLKAAHEGALAGVEATKYMIASTGKARSLGERSIGYPDPGAISVSIIFGAMSCYASGRG